MTFPVRRACLESDKPALIELLQANLPYRQHAAYFQWLYRDNPAGEALALVATDPDSEQIVGAAAAFPRRMYRDGSEAQGYVLGDFCILPAYRSLGLALSLQRTCLASLSSCPTLVFDFPSQSMLAIYKRLRIDVNENMIRHAKPLRADRKIAAHAPVGVARGLSTLVNAGLRLRERARKPSAQWRIAPESGTWGEEFTRAAREWNSARIGVLRTADYLNWRYRRHPMETYEMLTARTGTKLCGYLLFHAKGEDCTIDDLLAEAAPVSRALLAEATAMARQRGIHTISAPWLSTHPGRHLLEQCGFRPRESCPVILHAIPEPAAQQAGRTRGDWYLTNGDWEA